MSNVLTFNAHNLLQSLEIKKLLQDYQHINWDAVDTFLNRYNWAVDFLYGRFGNNTMPFKISKKIIKPPPKYDQTFSKTFSDISDEVCVYNLQKYDDKGWVVQWSGGIDSTLLVVSILKNSTFAQREHIKIATNRVAIYENPYFYFEHIKPNFQVVDIENAVDVNKNYIFNGEPADQLFSGLKFTKLMLNNKADTSFIKNPTIIKNYLIDKFDINFANWYCDKIFEDIEYNNAPVESNFSVFWWDMFNWSWYGILSREYFYRYSHLNYDVYMSSIIHWFDTPDYQQWAMVNNMQGIKYGESISEYKIVMKKYIYEYDKNEFYYNNKTKIGSTSREKYPTDIDIVLDDYSTLSINKDMDKILNLLPNIIN